MVVWLAMVVFWSVGRALQGGEALMVSLWVFVSAIGGVFARTLLMRFLLLRIGVGGR